VGYAQRVLKHPLIFNEAHGNPLKPWRACMQVMVRPSFVLGGRAMEIVYRCGRRPGSPRLQHLQALEHEPAGIGRTHPAPAGCFQLLCLAASGDCHARAPAGSPLPGIHPQNVLNSKGLVEVKLPYPYSTSSAWRQS